MQASQHSGIKQAKVSNSPLAGALPLKRVCYFRMDPQTEIKLNQVDGNLCTHIIMAFARLDSQGNLILASETDREYLNQVREFKRQFPHIKIMISVFNEQEFNGFPKIASDAELRQRFARSTIEFLKHYNLDGIDLDWEFPNFPTTFISRDHERTGLTKIIKTLRSAFVENFYDRQVAEQHLHSPQSATRAAYLTGSLGTSSIGSGGGGSGSQVEPYLLTVAIAAQEAILRVSYELKHLANLCDWLNVMSYDYYLFKPYAPFTGPNSPLHPIVDRYVPVLSKLSFSWSIERLLEEGIESDKIVMGIPTYARAYRLMFKNSQAAPFTLALGSKTGRIQDYLDYREVCDLISKPGTIMEFDERARVPYMLTDDGYTWISFENVQSVREKVRHICKNGLAGYMTWNLNSDHFTGHQKGSHSTTTNGHHEQSSNDDVAAPAAVDEALGIGIKFPLHRAMLDELLEQQK